MASHPAKDERPQHGVKEMFNGEWRWWVQDDDVGVGGIAPTREEAEQALRDELEEWWS